jgi:DNA-binding transcriptional LysR family regulator
MDLRHLRTFLAVAEELHFGRAAARLRVAQPAVSQAVKSLEDEVGAVLFTRTKRSVALSAAGLQFMGHARNALREVDEAASAARRAAAGETGRLVVRFAMMGALGSVPGMLARFRRERPGVELRIEVGGSTEQLDAIVHGRCDVGFMAWRKELPRPLRMHLVDGADLVAVVSSKHALARRPSLHLQDLAEMDFIFLGHASEPHVRALFARHCAAAGFEPRFILDVEHLETLLALVAAGLGVSCVPNFLGRLRFAGVRVVTLRPTVRAGICAVWHPGMLSPAGRHLLELLGAPSRSIVS